MKHPKGFLFVGPKAMQTGRFEPSETKFLLEYAADFDVFVNIGANCGYYVCMAKQLGLHVVAVEPHPLSFNPLLRNMDINGWGDVEVFPVALSEKPGLLRLYGSGTGASLLAGWAQNSRGKFITVPVSTLDRILGGSLANKRLLFWIDVEGAELQVLNGALAQFDRVPSPVWVIEISICDLQPTGTKVNPNLLETFKMFWSRGYRALNLDGGEISDELVKKWHSGQELIGGSNFVFRR